ncbi:MULTISPECIES: hypothetical protein [Micromonospora]|uniref:Uncharacterized protein n=1 Tax=Micromonospora yangpuensis TaxID=683228 RepID=A0A1C6TXE6_9ACTN|nr:hypothetical protein [Micromonospora yangpuensis]SCL46502.1 hypothetical protein GA0070617_0291 [Micromonospora yangpuensis]
MADNPGPDERLAVTIAELDAATGTLAGSDTLAFGGVGLAGTMLPATEAYQRLLTAVAARPDEVRTRLDWLLGNGSPAGRAYAATLLDRLDPSAGRAAWAGLRGETGELTTFTGCLMERTTLGQYADARLVAP